jgi:ankyrin repeat protein
MAVQQLLVRDNFKADSKDEEGWTPLSWTATNGYEDVIQQLLKRQHCKERLERIVKRGCCCCWSMGLTLMWRIRMERVQWIWH